MVHKLYCLVSLAAIKKMGGNRGKMMTQAGHAYVHATWDASDRFPEALAAYRDSERAFKITLVVESEDDLRRFYDVYKDRCGASLVTDAGLTVFNEPTTTCLGLGPIAEDLMGEDLKALRPFM